jgi:hypothetical protein
MQARRSFSHGSDGGWSSIALHIQAAENGKEGFYLTLFPDGRPPAVVFLSPRQVIQLLDMAQSSATEDHAIWDVVAKIPLEPLLPSRTLSGRLRALLVDYAGAIREAVREQQERRPPPSPDAIEPTDEVVATEVPPKPPWQIS